jgi:hypothetical protein
MRYRLWNSLLVVAAALAFTGLRLARPEPNRQAPKYSSGARNFTKDPDVSGIWTQHPTASQRAFAVYSFLDARALSPLMTPWSLAKFEENKPGYGPDAVPKGDNDPTVSCYPPGTPRVYLHLFPMEIIQLPGLTLELFEYDHFVRRIYTDGRPHPGDLQSSWMGHSIGRWEGDSLLADTVGLNDKTWIDRDGHPHSDKMRVIERIRRLARDTLQVGITIEDPVAYAKPFSGAITYQLRPDWDINEHICEENSNDTDLEK